jgi:1,4-dihydroxy-2-naphthoate octaprenyltransferase
MKKWIQAARLRTLPLAASCILTGAAAAKLEGETNGLILTLTLFTTFLLQILSNLANDYGDYSHGVDNENRVGPARALQSGAISKASMKSALIITTVATLLSGLSLLWLVFAPKSQFVQALLMLVLGLAAIAAAIKYTVGSNPYGYRGLGDFFVFLFFGPVGVIGTYYLLTGAMTIQLILPAITTGLYSAAVLNLNNLRDHINDKASGKLTLVVKMGFQNGKVYQSVLVGAGTLTLVAWVLLHDSINLFWSLVPAIAQCLLLIKVWRCETPASLDGELKKVALLTFAMALLLFVAP